MGEDFQNQEYGRPRRPNPETVTYLRGLPLDESLAAEQVRAYVDYHKNSTNNGTEANAEPPEYPPLLTATHAALSSIQNELASLSCEEHSSGQIETLIRISCRFSVTAKRVVLASMASYWPFMCTHRFGSHVAQTVLRCVVAECEVNLEELDEEGKMIVEDSYASLLENEDSGVPSSLSKLLIQTLEELKPYASELAVHVCGTHVLRTGICILSGVEFIDAYAPSNNSKDADGKEVLGEWETGPLAATRRGKFKDKKKKKKKRPAPGEGEGGPSQQEVTVMKVMKVIPELQSDEFHNDTKELLKEMIATISLSNGDDSRVRPPGELQQRTCHPSAGPLLVQMLRILSYLDAKSKQSKKSADKTEVDGTVDRRLGIIPKDPRYTQGSNAENLVHRLLCWDASVEVTGGAGEGEGSGGTAKQVYAGDIIYGLSGEPRGSILLEAIFRCCPDSFHDALCTAGGFYDEETLREYINHGVSNFVVQALLNTVRSQQQTARMVKCLCGIVEDGSILRVKGADASADSGDADNDDSTQQRTKHRMGVIWRAFEMCATNGSSQDQEQLVHALMRGYAAVCGSSKNNTEEVDDSKRKKRSKSKGLPVNECIPLLLGLSPNEEEDESARLSLDAAGARALYHIFHFNQRLRSDWVSGLVKVYSQGDLAKIANDGLGSRW